MEQRQIIAKYNEITTLPFEKYISNEMNDLAYIVSVHLHIKHLFEIANLLDLVDFDFEILASIDSQSQLEQTNYYASVLESITFEVIDPEIYNTYDTYTQKDYDNQKNNYEIYKIFKNYFDQISQLSIEENVANKWLIERIPLDNIVNINQLKKTMCYKMSELLMELPTYDESELNFINTTTKMQRHRSKQARYVLNKNNPFSDIAIENNQFLYATDKGQFNTLSFVTNQTLTKVTQSESSYLALIPSFKVQKTVTPFDVTDDITIDDTVSTPIAENNSNKIMLYI